MTDNFSNFENRIDIRTRSQLNKKQIQFSA